MDNHKLYLDTVSKLYVRTQKLFRNLSAEEIIHNMKLHDPYIPFNSNYIYTLHKNKFESLSRIYKFESLYRIHRFIHAEKSDILVGIYIPMCNIGDIINITSEFGDILSIIEITNTNQFYLPINNKYFLHINKLAFHQLHISIIYKNKDNVQLLSNNTNDIYLIYVKLIDKLANYVWETRIFLVIDELNMLILYSLGHLICDDYDEYNAKYLQVVNEGKKNYIDENDAKNKGAVNIIERAYIYYKKNRFFYKWRTNIKTTNKAIEYLPCIGVKYFEALQSYNNH
jgi:hypothetical protein